MLSKYLITESNGSTVAGFAGVTETDSSVRIEHESHLWFVQLVQKLVGLVYT